MWRALPPLAVLAAVLGATFTSAASAAPLPPQPLVDVPPLATDFTDHVGPLRVHARRAGDSAAAAYKTPDGLTVSVKFSGSYDPDPAVAQTYVDFLGSLLHGPELGKLRVYIATPSEVLDECGGAPGTLACYDPSTNTMAVPGEQTSSGGNGVTTSYVVAHEYGHHVATYRSNEPFLALNWGPKYWASRELVCLNTIEGRLAPGDEGRNYLSNPGEAWADTYAHLKYPAVRWQYHPILRPDQASKAAARRDVLTPWKGNMTKKLRGSFAPGGADVKAFRVVLRLDGSLRVALRGPAATNYNIEISSLGVNRGSTKSPTSRDTYATRYACREVHSENVLVKIVRRFGYGPFLAVINYAG